MPLSKKQISSLTEYSRERLHINSETKTKVINSKLKNYGIDLQITPDKLEWFYDEYMDKLIKQNKRDFFIKSQEGKIDSTYTPINLSKTTFEKVTCPEIDCWYHLSWAFKGAKFLLKKIINDKKGIVWTGKTNNKEMEINLDDLRHFANKRNLR